MSWTMISWRSTAHVGVQIEAVDDLRPTPAPSSLLHASDPGQAPSVDAETSATAVVLRAARPVESGQDHQDVGLA
jgi:hypothetical protein